MPIISLLCVCAQTDSLPFLLSGISLGLHSDATPSGLFHCPFYCKRWIDFQLSYFKLSHDFNAVHMCLTWLCFLSWSFSPPGSWMVSHTHAHNHTHTHTLTLTGRFHWSGGFRVIMVTMWSGSLCTNSIQINFWLARCNVNGTTCRKAGDNRLWGPGLGGFMITQAPVSLHTKYLPKTKSHVCVWMACRCNSKHLCWLMSLLISASSAMIWLTTKSNFTKESFISIFVIKEGLSEI